MYCVGGSLKNLCHFEMGGLANADVIRGSLNADSCWEGGKICQNLADVICERFLSTMRTEFLPPLLMHARARTCMSAPRIFTYVLYVK